MLTERKPLEEKNSNNGVDSFDVLVNDSLNQDQQKLVTFRSADILCSPPKKAVEGNVKRPQTKHLEHHDRTMNPPNDQSKKTLKDRSPVSGDDNSKDHQKHLTFMTPKRQKTSRSSTKISSTIKKRSGKLIRRLTPPRHLEVGCRTPKRRSFSGDTLTLSPRYSNAKSFELRSCELDPSEFQMEIARIESCLQNCLICSIMDTYVEKGGVNFDFASLMQWAKPNQSTEKSLAPFEAGYKENSVLSDLKKVADDITVEGFFREYYPDSTKEGGLGRVEVSIFSSNQLGRFIVCYRGSSDVQDRPVHGKGVSGQLKENRKQNIKSKDLADDCRGIDQKVTAAYSAPGLKESVFTLLNRLTALKPFTDVTMTGHSFGACLATLAGKDYATERPQVRVACQVFGSPHVGGKSFRNEVHSLPNLNVGPC